MLTNRLDPRLWRTTFKFRNRYLLCLDTVLLLCIPAVALGLRTDNFLSEAYAFSLAVYTAASLPFWLGVFLLKGSYSQNWLYAGVEEVGVMIRAGLVGVCLNIVLFFFVLRPAGLVVDTFPRTIPFLNGLLVLIALGLTRVGMRWIHTRRQSRQHAPAASKRVAVYGAGQAGLMIVRELFKNPHLGMTPVAFLDDDTRKHRMTIHGLAVAGGRGKLAQMARSGQIDKVIIAMPTAPGKTLREITMLCAQANVPALTVPGMYELLQGTVTVNNLRNVEIEDLLRRAPIRTESNAIEALLRGKRVLVTGAGGSIGGELCRQIAQCAPAELVLVGHGENSIFVRSNALAAEFPELAFSSVIADVRDAPRMDGIMRRYRPELVFHAAAHKHVSLMEHNLEDAVTNNIVGTRVTLDAAHAHGVESFVMISTDKAVNPESVMGATKRAAELYVHARAVETGQRYVVVRFGNVLGSRGSVVPIFKQQIANGGPVRVTHPEVRRFFMTIPEAVHLVLQAAALGRGGEIFALDMGEPVKIVDLARDLIRLSGLKAGRDIEIEFIGLRPGEKMYEELFVPGELYERTASARVFVARNGSGRTDTHARLLRELDGLVSAARAGDTDGVRTRLAAVVPEFRRGQAVQAGGSI